jgi:hypothetical protein
LATAAVWVTLAARACYAKRGMDLQPCWFPLVKAGCQP